MEGGTTGEKALWPDAGGARGWGGRRGGGGGRSHEDKTGTTWWRGRTTGVEALWPDAGGGGEGGGAEVTKTKTVTRW